MAMNRYLAICHALSLLEDEIRPEKYAEIVLAANPLFHTPCSRPLRFIDVLKAEDYDSSLVEKIWSCIYH